MLPGRADPPLPERNPGVPAAPPCLQCSRALSHIHGSGDFPRDQSWPKPAAQSRSAFPLQGFTKQNPAQTSAPDIPSSNSHRGSVSRAWMPIGSGACREQELDSSLWMFLHPHCLQTLQSSGCRALGFLQPETRISPCPGGLFHRKMIPLAQREVWNVTPIPCSFLHPSRTARSGREHLDPSEPSGCRTGKNGAGIIIPPTKSHIFPFQRH